ncbi:MAG: hypothetical protein PHX34_06020 [Candidatus Shapirobacteria bacterium]|nr:hypothetical protein [Candidatus Shapirobacteria bacterium]
MRSLIIPILFLLSCTNSTNKSTIIKTNIGDGFCVIQDTITCDIKGEMTYALKFHEKYYVLFEEITKNNYGGYPKRWLYIFSNGEIEKKVDFPKELDVVYLDFFVHNDSIILKPYMDERIYNFDPKDYVWKEIKKTNDLIFEDEKYWVYSLDFGEWGGKTWFKDKNTGIEYELEATTPLVNKIDTTYYLTNSFKVLKIISPLFLNKCQSEVTYENIEKNGEFTNWYGKPIGYHEIYRDTTFNYFDSSYKPSIVSSFVSKNKLLHLYETDTVTYIAEIKNNSIKPIHKIAKNLRFYNWSHSYSCRNQNGNNELLKFKTNKTELNGLIDIVDNNIFIHYFVNRAELYPKSVGSLKADFIFIERLNLVLSTLHNLKIKTVESEENKWKTNNNTPNHNVGLGGNSWNTKKYTIDDLKSFLLQEDSYITNTTEYYGTKEKNLVRIVIFEWSDTDFLKSLFDESAKEHFKTKLTFLENRITQKVGKSIKEKNEKNYIKKIWKTKDGMTLELESMKNCNRIRLVIFQN